MLLVEIVHTLVCGVLHSQEACGPAAVWAELALPLSLLVNQAREAKSYRL